MATASGDHLARQRAFSARRLAVFAAALWAMCSWGAMAQVDRAERAGALTGLYFGADGARLIVTPRETGYDAFLTRDGRRRRLSLEGAGASTAQSLDEPAALVRLEAIWDGPGSEAAVGGVTLLWAPIGPEGAPDFDQARYTVFLRAAQNADDGAEDAASGPLRPQPGALSFIESYALWSSDKVTRRYAELTGRARALIGLFPHVETDILMRICAIAPPSAKPGSLEGGAVSCEAVLRARDAALKSGGFNRYTAALARERAALLTAAQCADGALPRTTCLKAAEERADQPFAGAALLLRRYAQEPGGP